MTSGRFAKLGWAGLIGLAIAGGPAVQAAETKPAVSASKRWETEFSLWQKVSSGSDPAGYEAYLKDYPNGTFASMARLRLAELNARGVASTAGADDGKPQDSAATDAGAASEKEKAAAARKADEAARLKAEQEARIAAEKQRAEEERLAAEAEAKRVAEAERQRKEEQARAEAEAKRVAAAKAEAERQRAEAERKRAEEAAEAERLKAEQQAKAEQARLKAEEEARAAAEAKARADAAAAAQARAEAEQVAAEAERERAIAAAEAEKAKAEEEARATAEAQARETQAREAQARADAAAEKATAATEAERARAEQQAAQPSAAPPVAEGSVADALDTEALPTDGENAIASPAADPDGGPATDGAADAVAAAPAGGGMDGDEAGDGEAERLARREDNSWSRAVLNGRPQAFENYLREFPQGRFADEARQRLAALEKGGKATGGEEPAGDVAAREPAINAPAATAAPLGAGTEPLVRQTQPAPSQQPKVFQTPSDVREAYLDPAARAQSQRWLNALGYGTGGADGVYGPRTRAAIASWQRSAGYAGDGYLTRKQYRELRQSARFAEARSREYVDRQRARRDRYYNDGYGVYEGPVDGYYREGPVGGVYEGPVGGGYGPGSDLTISGPGY
ncbi:peptidoglycan-binding protein [Rhizobium sp. TRM96647]|uniref:peptidoglycan-binding domain-containing protein n=1 Tax=unclassified Rhizobium TaxID=2613769 RepID=UPI0021E87DC2|nr:MULTISPECIES: peptidoglycan-binding protein [unclassified Rhizobium]MCV3737010.1 peptidoglycan-binding protein [Rhizobium sp. TRM96647]MCV3756590.1 peptidoglycan-binding protein [Rhizobium sp. TRM96650]